MVIGDQEFQFSWEDSLISKGKEITPEQREYFFKAIKYSMFTVAQNFNIMFPKFKVKKFPFNFQILGHRWQPISLRKYPQIQNISFLFDK